MAKRGAEAEEEIAGALKAGERPMTDAPHDEMGEFEDEFEDEFESEDEILEAGVDGRPDAEREEEEEEQRGTWLPLELALRCAFQLQLLLLVRVLTFGGKQMLWRLISRLFCRAGRNWRRARHCRRTHLPMKCSIH